jgi:hypothetical protein
MVLAPYILARTAPHQLRTVRNMGRSHSLPPGAVSVPTLSRLAGLTHSRTYQLLKAGKGPKLTPIIRASATRSRARQECFVAATDALEWLTARLESTLEPERRAQIEDGIRHLRIERIMAHIRSGEPLPRPDQAPFVSANPRRPGPNGQPADLPAAAFAIGART